MCNLFSKTSRREFHADDLCQWIHHSLIFTCCCFFFPNFYAVIPFVTTFVRSSLLVTVANDEGNK